MKTTIHLFLITLMAFMLSCENENPKTENIQPKQEQESEKIKEIPSPSNHSTLIEKLQGTWKEPEYPFRRAEFKDTTVKFTEEGVIEPPSFKPFEISDDCPFLSDSPANDDTYFVNPENEICEKISVRNDTLTFRGVKSDYTIVYERME